MVSSSGLYALNGSVLQEDAQSLTLKIRHQGTWTPLGQPPTPIQCEVSAELDRIEVGSPTNSLFGAESTNIFAITPSELTGRWASINTSDDSFVSFSVNPWIPPVFSHIVHEGNELEVVFSKNGLEYTERWIVVEDTVFRDCMSATGRGLEKIGFFHPDSIVPKAIFPAIEQVADRVLASLEKTHT